MLGKTNACIESVLESNVTAINKTGAIIRRGDKVWLNKNKQTAGSYYNITNSETVVQNKQAILSRTGNFGVCNGNCYVIKSDKAIKVSDLDYNIHGLKYMADNSIFVYNWYESSNITRIDDIAQYSIPNSEHGVALGKDFIITADGDSKFIKQIDLSNGNILKTWNCGSSISENLHPNKCTIVNDKIYDLYSGTFYTLNDYFAIEESSFSIDEVPEADVTATTIDNKYIICGSHTDALRIVEVIDISNLRTLSYEEMPNELKAFYNGFDGGIYTTFNPYTGILTIAANNTQNYAIMKYENGMWHNIPLEINLTDDVFCGAITVSDDLTRAICNVGFLSSEISPYMINIKTMNGYIAQPFKKYNIEKETIIGSATSRSLPDENVEVNVNVETVDNEKYGLTTDAFLGDIDENGVLQPSTGQFQLKFTDVQTIGANSLARMFNNNKTIVNVDLDTVDCVEDYAFDTAFQNSYGISSLLCPNLTVIKNAAFNNCFYGCRNLNTIYCPKLITIEDSGFYNAFQGCQSLSTVDFPSLTTIGNNGMYGAFSRSNISSISFPKLVTVGMGGLNSAFSQCANITTVVFPMLTSVGSSGLYGTFGYCSNLASVSFPSLTDVQTSSLNSIFGSCSNLKEIHFRADMQEIISTLTGYADKWGATIATIYFDL